MAIAERFQRFLPRNRFARSVSILAGGTAAGQAIVVLASPLLTRLYSPEDFGLLAVYAALLGIIGVVASLRYQLAIPLPESDEEAAHVVVLGLLVVLGMTGLTTLAVVFFRESIAAALNTPALAGYLWLLPVGLLLAGVYEVFNYWAIRVKAFPAIARTRLTQALSTVTVQLGGYMLGPLALLLGQISGQAAGTGSLGALAIGKRWDTFRRVQLAKVWWAAGRYKRFPVYSTWGGLFNTTSTQLPPLVFAVMFSATAAGLYILAHRVLAMPTRLIGRAIADVFFSNAADAKRNGTLAPLVASIHDKLAHIAMPPTLVLILAGPELFAVVFGTEWRVAGEFAQWMAPWIYLMFITSPLSLLFPVLEKQKHEVLFQGLLVITRLLALLIGAWHGNLMTAVVLFSLGSAVCYLGLLVWEIQVSGNVWSVIYVSTLRALLGSGLAVSPLVIVQLLDVVAIYWWSGLALSALFVGGKYMHFGRGVGKQEK